MDLSIVFCMFTRSGIIDNHLTPKWDVNPETLGGTTSRSAWPRQGPGAHQPARGCLVPFLKGDVKSKGKGKIPQFLMVKYIFLLVDYI